MQKMQLVSSAITAGLSLQAKDDLAGLRRTLDRVGYFNVMALYGSELPRQSARALDRFFVPEPLQSLIGFCEFGGSCHPEILGLSGQGAQDLVAEGLLLENEFGVALNDLRLIAHYGCLLLCSNERPDAFAYYGEDTLALARHVLTVRPGQHVLDLCGGLGTQSVLAARLGAHTVSVELNPALRVFKEAAIAMNPVSGSISFCEGDLYSALTGSARFDHIFANPPLVPVAPGQPIGIASDGGIDGLDMSHQICDQAAMHLHPEGRLVLQGLTFGNSEGPELERILAPLARDGFKVVIATLYVEALDENGPMMRALASTGRQTPTSPNDVTSAYIALAEKQKHSHLFSWQIFATLEGMTSAPDIVPLHRRSSKLWLI